MVIDEIIPTMDMEKAELEKFADDVFDRFRNPYVKHQLSSIALNSISKFKVRVLPSLLEYCHRENKLPLKLVYAFACLIRFYKGSWNGNNLPLKDNAVIIDEFAALWKTNSLDEITQKVLSRTDYWGEDLTQIKELSNAISTALKFMEEEGIQAGFANFTNTFD